MLIFLAEKEMELTEPEASKDIKVLLEMAIHELCIAQERVTEVHKTIHKEIHHRIMQALSSLDEIVAFNAIEMDEDIHHTFLQSFQKAKELQEEVSHPSTKDDGSSQLTFQEKGKAQISPDSSETEEDDEFTLILPKAMKPLQELVMKKALTMEQYSSYTNWVYSAQTTNS